MDRVWKSGAAGSPPVHTENASTGYPTAGNPGTGTPATKPGPWMWHLIVENLRAIVVAAGLTPDKSLINQVLLALQVLFAPKEIITAWTPVIGGAGGESGQTYTSQSGTTHKQGRKVTVFCNVQLSAKGTITGNVQLKGLPFTSSSVKVAVAMRYQGLATNWVSVVGSLETGAVVIDILGAQAAAASNSTPLTTTDIGDGTNLSCSFSYLTP